MLWAQVIIFVDELCSVFSLYLKEMELITVTLLAAVAVRMLYLYGILCLIFAYICSLMLMTCRSFHSDNSFAHADDGPILQKTVVEFDAETGRVINQWGDNLYVPKFCRFYLYKMFDKFRLHLRSIPGCIQK